MTTLIGAGFCTKKDPFEAAKAACLQAQEQIKDHGPSIVFLFSSIHLQDPKLLEGAYAVFGRAQVIGCTGAGVIDSSGVHAYGVGVLAFYSTKINVSTSSVRSLNKQNPREAGVQFARNALQKLGSQTRELAIVFSDGLIENGSFVLMGIKEVLGRSFPIVGGLAADNLRFVKTYQYFNKEILNNALVGTILSGEGRFGYGVRHGWQPLGRPRLVTRSRGNILFEVENQPAIEIYKTYFGKERSELQSLLAQISILYPLGIYVSDEEEYLLRNPLQIGNNGELTCQGDIPTGSQVRLMIGTKESALQAAQQAITEAHNALEGAKPLGVLVFESISRVKLLGYRVQEEINLIKQAIGDNVPLIGVCTFGEEAPLKSVGFPGESRLHNDTLTLVVIGEQTRHAFGNK